MENPNICGCPPETLQPTMVNNSTTPSSHFAVVIPVRNRPDLLERCLDSLQKQQFPGGRWEILVCDDGSTEDLTGVVGRFQSSLPHLRHLRQPPKGPAAARNMGFRSSSADIMVCVDSDVICKDGFLLMLTEALGIHPTWMAAGGTVLPIGEEGTLFDAPVNNGGIYPTGASAYRAAALKEVGGLDEAFPFPACEDAEMAARILKLGEYGYVPEAIVYHPTRPITVRAQWHSRKYWRYVMILAKRYGFLAFPGHPAGPFPRLRVAWAAVVTLPAGRFIKNLKHMRPKFSDGLAGCLFALFDVLCGMCALPQILFGSVPRRQNYLIKDRGVDQRSVGMEHGSKLSLGS
jgi:GT2 family glycosyltransferase